MISCKNCNVEVPPTWVHVININTCPACGSTLLNEQEVNLLEEIRDAFKRMPNNPEGLAGWILSNYRLQKIGLAEPVQFPTARTWTSTKPVDMNPGEYTIRNEAEETTFSDVENPTSPGEKTSRPPLNKGMFEGMMKRAGVKVPDSAHLKNLVSNIKSGGVTPGTVEMDEDGEMDDDGDVFVSASDPEEAMIDALASGKGVDPKVMLRQHKLAEARAELRNSGSVGMIRRGG